MAKVAETATRARVKNITSQITMPWSRPCCSYQLEIFRQYARFVLGKVRKFQDPSSSRLGDI